VPILLRGEGLLTRRVRKGEGVDWRGLVISGVEEEKGGNFEGNGREGREQRGKKGDGKAGEGN